MNILFSLAVTVVLASPIVNAWSINGHMLGKERFNSLVLISILVANVAQNLLQQNDKESFKAAMTLLGYLKTSDPTLTQHEDKHSFVECATFADDIKYHAGGWQGDFHFIDQPFIEEGKESDYKISKNAHTLTQGIQDITDWLSGKNGKGYEKSYIFDFIQNRLYPDKPDLAKSYALRLLIHYVGDMVQPFHAESRYNSANPSGDKGANGFPLPNHYEVKELHALIDKVLYVEHTNISRVSLNS